MGKNNEVLGLVGGDGYKTIRKNKNNFRRKQDKVRGWGGDWEITFPDWVVRSPLTEVVMFELSPERQQRQPHGDRSRVGGI